MLTPPFTKRDTAGPARFQFGKLVLPAGDVQPVPVGHHHIVMHMGGPVATRRSLDGKTRQRLQLPGDFDAIPAGTAGRWRNEGDVELMLIEIDPGFVTGLGDDNIAPAPFLPLQQLRDRQLHHLALVLMAEHQSGMPTGRLYSDSLMTALLIRFMSLRNGELLGQEKGGDRFSLSQQRRLTEFIEDNIASGLSLAELAGVVGYGVSRFKTLFKNSFGATPHVYVLTRRVEHARVLIETGALSLSQIALESGFSHQSHMAVAFRKTFGVSPAHLRPEEK
jgi:AraC family transcriptional regulator